MSNPPSTRNELRTDIDRHRARVAIALRQLQKTPKAVVDALGPSPSVDLPANAEQFPEYLGSIASRLAGESVAGRTVARSASPPVELLDARGAWDGAGRILAACDEQGIVPVAVGDPRFPGRLAELQGSARGRGGSLGGYCPILYCKGSVESLHADCAAAVIGTREPTEFGRDKAYEFGRALAQEQVVVVSGLARGCDTGAHKGCVDAGGRSVAVLAHGLDRVYPSENADLADALVAVGGCLVSEYAPGVPPHRRYFGFRDRIQAGLADLVIVIETPARDGTLITVDYAGKQRRPVGCLEHPPMFAGRAETAGNRQLLGRQAGIMPLVKPEDALRVLREPRPAVGASAQPSLLDGAIS